LDNITNNMTSGYFLVLVSCVVKSFKHLETQRKKICGLHFSKNTQPYIHFLNA